MINKHYLLTESAERDFVEARNWSLKRWGKQQTIRYFQKIEDVVVTVAAEELALPSSDELTGSVQLKVWPVGEHYLVYVPVRKGFVIVVSLIRQVRDVPEIISRNMFAINRELRKIDLAKLPR